MGCTTSTNGLASKQDDVQGEDVNFENVEDENPYYPLPYVPETSKSEIWDQEVNRDIQDRIDNIPPGTDAAYKTLLEYLSGGATKDIHHAIAIYLWMKNQDYESASLDQNELDQSIQGGRRTNKDKRVNPNPEGPQDTPRGYMKLIKDGKGDFTTFFTILCRRSGIPCNIIRGIAKDEKFYIGMTESLMVSTWTTFFVDQEWRLAHIDWAMENRTDKNRNELGSGKKRSGIPCNIIRGIAKDEKFYIGMPESQMVSSWTTIFVDQEWRLAHIDWAMENRTDKNKNIENNNISDFYFMMDPDDFAHFCHPDDFNWQLLNQPMSKKEFLLMPNVRPASFLLDMDMITPKQSTTKTSRHATEVEIMFPKKMMEEIEVSFVYKFHHEVSSKKEQNIDTKSRLPKSLKNFVFINRRQTKFTFEIQFPAAGKYLFDIYAKHYKATKELDSRSNKSHKSKVKEVSSQRLIQFRLICELDPEEGDIEPFPESPEQGWGPGPSCRLLGLVPLTHCDSYIFIKPGEFRDIRFRMLTKLEVQCQLTHNYLPIYQLVEQIEQEIERDEVHIKVRIPEDGTYALKIYCRPTGTKEFNEACVYLLKQQAKSRLPENYERGYRRKYRDKMIRSKLEYHIANHTNEQDLRDAIEMYHVYNVPDHGELKQGHEKLKQYWEVKRELQLALKGRNVRNLDKWLERAKRSKYKDDLLHEIQKAEALEGNMTKRKGYAHPIARMDEHTITEIHNYKRPPKVVQDVMKSTYILLGEDTEYLHAWEHLQYLMGRPGKDGLKKLILSRKVDDVTLQQACEAQTVLQPYNLDKCRAVSTGIGSFYKWCCQFIREIKDYYAEEQKRMKEHQLTEEFDTNMEIEGTMTSGASVSIKGLSPDPPPAPFVYDANDESEVSNNIPVIPDNTANPTNNPGVYNNDFLYLDSNLHEKEVSMTDPHLVLSSKEEMVIGTLNSVVKDTEIDQDLDKEENQDGLLVLNLDKRKENAMQREPEDSQNHPFEIGVVSPLED